MGANCSCKKNGVVMTIYIDNKEGILTKETLQMSLRTLKESLPELECKNFYLNDDYNTKVV